MFPIYNSEAPSLSPFLCPHDGCVSKKPVRSVSSIFFFEGAIEPLNLPAFTDRSAYQVNPIYLLSVSISLRT